MSQMGILNNQKTMNCQVYRTKCGFRIQIKIQINIQFKIQIKILSICIVYYINYNHKNERRQGHMIM